MARRPWVHDAHYADVDALLAATPGAAAVYLDRLFIGPFAARWLLRPAP